MLVATFTSWKGRLKNCPQIINNLLNQTCVPSRIYLVLAHEELTNGMDDVPEELKNMIDGEVVRLKWVEKNTKTMKKVFPILEELEDDDMIFYTDDDIILPEDLLYARYIQHMTSHNPITGNPYSHRLIGDSMIPISSPTSIITKRMLKNYDKFLNDEVVETYEDDLVYTAILKMNGYEYEMCNSHEVIDIQNHHALNPVDPARDGLYDQNYTLKVLNKRINELKDFWK